SISSYIKKSIITILRIFVVYKPFRFFLAIGLALFSLGLVLGLRYLYYYLTGEGSGHIQSVVLAGVMMGIGFQTFLVAFVADLLSVNRKLLEEVQYRLRKLESEPRSKMRE
ncbi:MAG: glycosyltransferase family 2 protein, partial [Candidatus Thiodiazotropha sp. 6PDIVS]